ncbi:4,5-DOPA dioxygenase extradiol [Proteus myxofaciens]|uniref:YgiD family protein n=1 Tax=Proteus myxofaciens ATCC 19692 TaxID=1354337 RepID=A0A198GBR8_9GAMM|nr:4,5-DOPA dioxygenase extradiol [Proteus myxofaciens]OAT33691.1 YgiD family protein [Proteus myxofaciens ATCC 19692]
MDTKMMPALFIGHGSPMNVLENNRYTRLWTKLGETLPQPKAILVISAHWYTEGTFATAMSQPKTIHDFYGFPPELYEIEYPAKGSISLVALIEDLINPIPLKLDMDQWGLDHGSWGILEKMYPNANIPVVQLSIDMRQSAQWHYELGQKLIELRREGVLIIGSGNVVHNLRMMDWQNDNSEPYPWALSFSKTVENALQSEEKPEILFDILSTEEGHLAHPTPEHFIPVLSLLGLRNENEKVTLLNNDIINKSLSMMTFQVG